MTLRALMLWGPRRWLVAALATLASLLVLGLPTDLVPNPVFGRQVAAPSWAWPVLVATAVLSGLLVATYVRQGDGAGDGAAGGSAAAGIGLEPDESGRLDTEGRRGAVGGAVAFFAVGCPVCNKIVLLALGYTGALRWFAPVQPYLAVLAIGLLGWALVARLRGQVACPVVPAAG